MSVVRPFKAGRPKKEFVELVNCPPYDVISVKEAREYFKKSEHNFVKVIRPEIHFPDDFNPYSEEVYLKGKENLKKYFEDGLFFVENKPSFYIYEEIMGPIRQVGLVATFSCKEYEEGKIKRHELTREEKEIDRAKHIDILNAQTEPVFLAYRSWDKLDNLILEGTKFPKEYDFEAEGVRHILYLANDDDYIEEVRKLFAELPHLYIADGHHRSQAGWRVMKWRAERNPEHTGEEEYNFFLAVVFPHKFLHIMDYNRVVKDLNGLTEEEFLAKIREKFDIELLNVRGKEAKPDRVHTFSMYLGGKWYRLKVKDTIIKEDDPILSLDVSILQNEVLDPILGIKDPRRDKRIDFVGGIRGLEELEKLVDSGEFKVAFALFPTTLEQLFRVADHGMIMPPKSTWFEPKLRSGLFIHLLGEI
ncbi:MAG: DUF1015 domain-containing protein [Candidatus Hydrothermia bacterium]|jgi:uncharacterized protein (DUF1015 family)